MTVVPAFHPAVALRPGGGGKLAHLAQAIKVWGKPLVLSPVSPPAGFLALDTEGTPDDPICLTWACRNVNGKVVRGTVPPKDVAGFWASQVVQGRTVWWHNALWDFGVMQAMGVAEPWKCKWRDTMQLAYLRQESSKSLKNLSWKHLGIKMKSFMDVVGPHYEEVVRAAVAGRIEAGTTSHTRYHKKTGKPLKNPMIMYTDEAKKLRRLRAVDSMVEAIDFPPPSLRYVPDSEREAYAEQDAVSTLMLAERWA